MGRHCDPQGFFTQSVVEHESDGRRGLLLYAKYFYFRKAFRGHYKTLAAPWLMIPICFRRFGLVPLHFVTSTYPQSYVSLARTSGNAVTLRTPGLDAWNRTALTRFASEFYGKDFDAGEGVIRNQNVVNTEGLPLDAEGERLRALYQELNPEWRDGVSLPILMSVTPAMMGRAARRLGKRTLRRFGLVGVPTERKVRGAANQPAM